LSVALLCSIPVAQALRPTNDFEGAGLLAPQDVRTGLKAHEAIATTDCEKELAQLQEEMRAGTPHTGAWGVMSTMNVQAWYDLHREIDFISRRGRSKLLRRVAQQVGLLADLTNRMARTIAGAANPRTGGTTVDDVDHRKLDEGATKQFIDTYFTNKVTLQVLHGGGAENRPLVLGQLLQALKTFRRMLPPALKRLKDKKHKKCFSYYWAGKTSKYERFMTEVVTMPTTGVKKIIHHPSIGDGSTGTPVWYIERIMSWVKKVDTERWYEICDKCIKIATETYKAQVDAASNYLLALFDWDERAFMMEPTEFVEED